MSSPKTTLHQYLALVLSLCFAANLIVPLVAAAQELNPGPARETLMKLADAFGGEMQISSLAFSVEGTMASERQQGDGTFSVNVENGNYLISMNYNNRESKQGFDGAYYWILDEHRALKSRSGNLHPDILQMLAMPAIIKGLVEHEGHIEFHGETQVKGKTTHHLEFTEDDVHDAIHVFVDVESGLPVKMRFLREAPMNPNGVDVEYYYEFEASEDEKWFVKSCRQFSNGRPRMTMKIDSIVFDSQDVSFERPNGLQDYSPQR